MKQAKKCDNCIYAAGGVCKLTGVSYAQTDDRQCYAYICKPAK